MASIATENLKKEIIDPLLTKINSGASPAFYVGLSRAEPWFNSLDSAPNAVPTTKEENDFRNSLQGIARVNSASHVVPRHNWTSGTTYEQYDDKKKLEDYTDASPFYVLTLNHGVYICLRTGRSDTAPYGKQGSTVEPTGSNNHPFETSDGYVWKFLYTVSALDANYYLTKNFMPVRFQESTDSNSTGIELKQFEIQTTAKRQHLVSFIVDSGNGGSNFTDSCKVAINGTTYHSATVKTDGGAIKKVEYNNDSSTIHSRQGLRGAVLTTVHSTGTGATIRPVFSSAKGIGANAVQDLKSQHMMLNVKVPGSNTDFITTQDFRQVGLLANMKDSLGTSGVDFTDNTGQALFHMKLSAQSPNFTKDRLVTGDSSGAKAFIDNLSSDNTKIFYHQNDSTGYLDFRVGEPISEEGGTGSGTIHTDSNSERMKPEVNPYSGDVLYIDNRAPIIRVPNQTEDIKVVIRLDRCT